MVVVRSIRIVAAETKKPFFIEQKQTASNKHTIMSPSKETQGLLQDNIEKMTKIAEEYFSNKTAEEFLTSVENFNT